MRIKVPGSLKRMPANVRERKVGLSGGMEGDCGGAGD